MALTPKQVEDFNIEMKALQLKYGVEINPVITLQLVEKKEQVEEAKIISEEAPK